MTVGESPNPTIKIDGQEIETVDRFMYLGNIVDVNDRTNDDVKITYCLNKTCVCRTYTDLEISKDNVKKKWWLFNTNVKSVLLYISECWNIWTSKKERKTQVFIHKPVSE